MIPQASAGHSARCRADSRPQQSTDEPPTRIREVDGVAFDVAITVAREDALHHPLERVTGEECPGAEVGIPCPQVEQTDPNGLLPG